jgi:hypothetical protein
MIVLTTIAGTVSGNDGWIKPKNWTITFDLYIDYTLLWPTPKVTIDHWIRGRPPMGSNIIIIVAKCIPLTWHMPVIWSHILRLWIGLQSRKKNTIFTWNRTSSHSSNTRWNRIQLDFGSHRFLARCNEAPDQEYVTSKSLQWLHVDKTDTLCRSMPNPTASQHATLRFLLLLSISIILTIAILQMRRKNSWKYSSKEQNMSQCNLFYSTANKFEKKLLHWPDYGLSRRYDLFQLISNIIFLNFQITTNCDWRNILILINWIISNTMKIVKNFYPSS